MYLKLIKKHSIYDIFHVYSLLRSLALMREIEKKKKNKKTKKKNKNIFKILMRFKVCDTAGERPRRSRSITL